MVESSKKTKADFECPVCLEVNAQPVTTPCKHVFCLTCQKKWVNDCPLCRQNFAKYFVPVVDTKLQEEIMANIPEAFAERKAELIAEGTWHEMLKRMFSIHYGNTHEDVQNPKAARSNPNEKNKHRWTMFVSSADGDHALTEQYIKSVTYHLHPSFKPNVIKVTKAPFLIARVGWGYFDVDFDIEF